MNEQPKVIIAQYFHYRIEEVYRLEALKKFKDHHRLIVFREKGTKCVSCGIEGTQLALGVGRGGKHIDVYTDDFYPLTVDHIIPKSLGGTNHPNNLQPMCCLCNWAKGNGIVPNTRKYSQYPNSEPLTPKDTRQFIRTDKIEIGKVVYRKEKTKKKKYTLLGTISKSCINPFTGQPAITVDEKPGSFFHLNNLYYERV